MAYATLADARRELGTTTTNATADAQLRLHLQAVSSRLRYMAGMDFEPLRVTEYLPIRGDLIRSDMRLYRLPRPALQLHAVTVYNTALTVDTHVRSWPSGKVPFTAMQLIDTSGDWYATYYDSNYDPLMIVDASFGYHRDYPNAWKTEDTVQDAGGINASATAVTVADADGANWEGFDDVFSPGQLLRIDDEYLLVTAVNTTTNVLTVQRGANGSTAAAHASGAAVEAWYPDRAVRQAVARQAALLYRRQGALAAPMAGGEYPSDLLADLLAVVQELMY